MINASGIWLPVHNANARTSKQHPGGQVRRPGNGKAPSQDGVVLAHSLRFGAHLAPNMAASGGNAIPDSMEYMGSQSTP